jgi:hypothetical protein
MRKCHPKTKSNTKRKRRQHKTNPKSQGLNMRFHKECSVVDPHPPMLVDSHLCAQGVEQYQISLTKVVGMMWMQKIPGFSMHVVYPSMSFAHPIGMIGYKPSMVPLKDTRSLGMTKLEPWDLTGVSIVTLVGYQLYLMVGQMLNEIH